MALGALAARYSARHSARLLEASNLIALYRVLGGGGDEGFLGLPTVHAQAGGCRNCGPAGPQFGSVRRCAALTDARRPQRVDTSIRRGWACACFGMRRVSTPSLMLASILALSSSRLSVKLRR